MKWHVIEAMSQLGGSASIAEIDVNAIGIGGYSEDQHLIGLAYEFIPIA